jgi:gamma-glutamyltranspeptidase/glutathione hydrolase
MQSSFGAHAARPGRLRLNNVIPDDVRERLADMGYELSFGRKTSGPMNAIFFDWKHGTMWGGSSNYGDDYGIAW